MRKQYLALVTTLSMLAAFACGTASSTPSPASVADASAALPPSVARACKEDLALGDTECAALAETVLPETVPPARGNAFAEDLRAADLGFRIFYDARFSRIPDVRCATCHLPEKSFGDGKAVADVKRKLPRNSPTILTAAWMTPYFWDGRADTLWSQPLFAFENPDEMDFTRLEIAHAIAVSPIYRPAYEAIFGAVPDLADSARFPSRGKPGDPAFDGMTAADRDTVNRFVANVGKSLEAYMRKVATGRSPVDRYLLGDKTALDASAQKGLATFVKAKCITCHSGTALSDGKFYDMHVPALAGAEPDLGRAAGREVLAANPFNAQGPYFDKGEVPPPVVPAPDGNEQGKFRTPTLRSVSLTAPYGHNGVYATVQDVLAKHGDVPLTEAQITELTVFMFSLNGTYPKRPWSDWPAR